MDALCFITGADRLRRRRRDKWTLEIERDKERNTTEEENSP